MYDLIWSPRFRRRMAKVQRAHPDLRPRLARVFRDLEKDPFQQYLRFHRIQGELDGLRSLSVTYSYRMVLTIEITEKEIVLLDIGTHDEVYG
ncbi:hypothetical protein BH23CHL1_BH23CHL1_21570 [soil metagenome]